MATTENICMFVWMRIFVFTAGSRQTSDINHLKFNAFYSNCKCSCCAVKLPSINLMHNYVCIYAGKFSCFIVWLHLPQVGSTLNALWQALHANFEVMFCVAHRQLELKHDSTMSNVLLAKLWMKDTTEHNKGTNNIQYTYRSVFILLYYSIYILFYIISTIEK